MQNECAECFGCCNSLWALDKDWEKHFPLPWLEIYVYVIVDGVPEPYTICPFFYIGERNICLIYDERPEICKEEACKGFMKFPPV